MPSRHSLPWLSRVFKLLMMDILMSETCSAHKKWNKIISDIKFFFYSSTITMMHGPINIRITDVLSPFPLLGGDSLSHLLPPSLPLSLSLSLSLLSFIGLMWEIPAAESNVYWTVHHCNSWRMKDQLDITCYFISLVMCSTCFGH